MQRISAIGHVIIVDCGASMRKGSLCNTKLIDLPQSVRLDGNSVSFATRMLFAESILRLNRYQIKFISDYKYCLPKNPVCHT